jgi:hypothetical protein
MGLIFGIFIGVFFMYAVAVFGSNSEEEEYKEDKNE